MTGIFTKTIYTVAALHELGLTDDGKTSKIKVIAEDLNQTVEAV